jgi:tRNA pseudouridine38-40 synthase
MNPKRYVYKMLIAYDGTLYGGWQAQINTTSIQTLIQNALSIILRKKTMVIASGRTDAGVHALGQVAHFTYSEELHLPKILPSLNALLPSDIRILALDLASSSFHARFSAVSKLYYYYLHLDPVLDPFQRLYTHRPPHSVDLDLLKDGARYFIGTHDFTSFANTRSVLSKNGNVRTIHRLDILEQDKGVCLAFEGNGFLYKMVRNIVGTLLDVCRGKILLSDVTRIFEAQDRRAAGIAAPPQGLFLMEVRYPNLLK